MPEVGMSGQAAEGGVGAFIGAGGLGSPLAMA
jgi:hypothetical protein